MNGHFQSILDAAAVQFEVQLLKDVAYLLRQNKWTIAIAEGLTAGQIGSKLTELPGSSEFFLGGVLNYHPMSKVKLLQVSPKTIQAYGIISVPVVNEILAGLHQLFKPTIALAVNGIAGPPNSQFPENATGKIIIGLRLKDEQKVWSYQFDGDRQTLRKKATITSLSVLKQWLVKFGEFGAIEASENPEEKKPYRK